MPFDHRRSKKRVLFAIAVFALFVGLVPSGAAAASPGDSSAERGRSLAGRWFYASQHIPNAGYKTYTVDFRKHHHAFGRTPRWPKFHRVPRCKSLKTPGCVTYRYRPATHKVRVGKRHGHLRKGNLRLAGVVYKRRHGVLPRGKKLKAKVAFMDWAGCDTVDFCGLWRTDLVLQRNGRFRANSWSELVSMPSKWKHVPDGKGTYRVLSRGRLRLTYSGGRRATFPFTALYRKGKPSPKGPFLIGREEFDHFTYTLGRSARTQTAVDRVRAYEAHRG